MKKMDHNFSPALCIGSTVRLVPPNDVDGALDGQIVTLRDGKAIASFGEWPAWLEAWAVSDLAYDMTNDTWTAPGSGRITYTT